MNKTMEELPNIDMQNEVIIQEATELRLQALRRDHDNNNFHNTKKLENKQKFLMAKYPDFRKYRLFHVIIGSTVDMPLPEFDFPGEDSIIEFLRSL